MLKYASWKIHSFRSHSFARYSFFITVYHHSTAAPKTTLTGTRMSAVCTSLCSSAEMVLVYTNLRHMAQTTSDPAGTSGATLAFRAMPTW